MCSYALNPGIIILLAFLAQTCYFTDHLASLWFREGSHLTERKQPNMSSKEMRTKIINWMRAYFPSELSHALFIPSFLVYTRLAAGNISLSRYNTFSVWLADFGVFLVSESSACEMCQTDTLETKYLCLFTDHAQDAVSLLDSQHFDVAIAFLLNIVAARTHPGLLKLDGTKLLSFLTLSKLHSICTTHFKKHRDW